MRSVKSTFLLVRRTAARFSEDSRRTRIAGMLTSAAIIGALVTAGHAIVPKAAPESAVRYYDATNPVTAVPVDKDIPVFIMDAKRRVVRNGVATATTEGTMRIEFFQDGQADTAVASAPLLFQPGFAVLWAAAPDAAQRRLLDRVAAVQEAGAKATEGILTSSVVASDYRPVLRDIVSGAVAQAWRDDHTQAALLALVERAEPEIAVALRGEAGDILRDHLKRAIWDMVNANWKKIFGALVGYQLDYTPVNAAVAAASSDPRVQAELTKLGSNLMETPEAAKLAERLAIGIVDQLVRDPRVPTLAVQMFTDDALRAELRPLSQALFALAASLPQDLGGLGNEADLNPLAAHVFKALALNAETPLILFVTPTDRTRIEGESPAAVSRLQPLAEGERG